MMVFSPYYRNEMLGNNAFKQPLPIVTDDSGTPFAVVVIPVDDKLAIKVAVNEKRLKVILITGANGASGSAVIREFARNGVPVRALVRSAQKAQELNDLPTVDIVVGDMLRHQTLGTALDGVERALMISSAGPEMLETQCRFIDAAKRAGVRHIVKFSGKESSIGFDAMRFRFTRMHEQIEDYLEASGVEWTHLRPSQFMQVYLREVPTIIAKSALFLPLENVKLAPIDLEDVAKVAFAVLRKSGQEGKSYEMTGPEALTMSEIADRISRVVGRTVHYVNVSPAERRRALLSGGMPTYLADALDEQAAEHRRCPESKVDLSAHAAFALRPTRFEEFAREHARIFGG
jgi:uncharacterized protein YbjT (DUF2867 family)